MEFVMSSENFLCCLCLTTYVSWEKLEEHLKIRHQTSDLEVKVEDTKFSTFVNQEVKVEDEEVGDMELSTFGGISPLSSSKQFLCSLCFRTFISWEELKDHLKICHQKLNSKDTEVNDEEEVVDFIQFTNDIQKNGSNAKEKNLICYHCKKTFVSLSFLRKHIKRFHSSLTKGTQKNECMINGSHEKEVICYHCQKPFVSLVLLKKHIKTFHSSLTKGLKVKIGKRNPNINKKNGRKVLSCRMCKYSTSNSGHLKRHEMAKHSDAKTLLSCSDCKYQTIYSWNLKQHIMAKHTNKKPLSCPHCVYRTIQKGHLDEHIRSKHEKLKTFKCPQCTFCTAHPGYLKHHQMSKHSDERPFKCTYCNYGAVQLKNLKEHVVLKHTKQKPLACHLCSYRTAHPGNLKRHVVTIHSDEKPYLCPHCDYRTAEAGRLKRHIKSMHTDRPSASKSARVNYKNNQPQINCDRVLRCRIKTKGVKPL